LHSAAAGSSTVVPPISILGFVPTLSVSTVAGPSTIGTVLVVDRVGTGVAPTASISDAAGFSVGDTGGVGIVSGSAVVDPLLL
jgi:hypothetical protein